MKIFGSITIMAAAILLISCGNASSPEGNNQEATIEASTNQDDGTKSTVAETGTEVNNESSTTANTNIGGKSKEVNEKPVYLTKDEFLKKVTNYQVNKETWKFEGDIPCIVDFYADWCRPCKMIAPIMEDLAKEYKGKINIYKVNTDKEKELAAAFGIRSIPSLLFCPMDGDPQMTQGAQTKEKYKEMIDQYLLEKN